MTFPLYRKRINNLHFYKFLSEDRFVELQLVGNKVFELSFEAKIYPDKLMIQDMINLKDQGITEIKEQEFLDIKKRLK